MKKKILIIICIVLLLITFKLLYNYVINKNLINKYNDGQYLTNQAKTLTVLNFSESYVGNYNYGNILYQNGEYEKSIEQFKKAISSNIPQDKDCNVRINYALAVCKTVNLDEENQDSIKNAITKYESAIEILTKNDCANDNNSGHNKQAQQLKNDIQKEIDRLKKLLNSDEEKEEEEQEEKNSKDENDIEAKIQQIKTDAIQEQRTQEEEIYNSNNFFKDKSSYKKLEKNW